VHEEINRLTRLSRQLVDLARPEDSRTALFNVKSSVSKAYQIARLDRRLKRCTVNLPENEEPDFALVNEDALIQIIMNLLFNAADATEGSGTIGIEITKSRESTVEIRVTDNGTGIPEDFQHKIFDPFFSGKTSGKGTGLGLSVSHSLARSFKGGLTIESSSEQGTTFLLEIPAK